MKIMATFEYLLIISPNKRIKRYVMKLKKKFADRYGCEKAAGLIPHITMANWLQSGYHEARIIANIRRFAETVNPFLAQFDGLGKFYNRGKDNSKTIVVNVFNKESFAHISKGLNRSSRHLLKKFATFPSTAHLTIARSMESEQFERAWSEWKDKEYKAYCEVSGMILLRRELFKEGHGTYKPIATFPFAGKQPHIQQLELGF